MAAAVIQNASLKETNGKRLFAVLALNIAAFYVIEKSAAVTAGDWLKLVTGWITALPAGVGVALTAVLNAQVSSDLKARLVFLRWANPYPGSRVFTQYGPVDQRVDMSVLEKRFGPLPSDPKEQNILWYRLYRTVRSDPAVENAHKHFLFARDYSFIALLCGVLLGIADFWLVHPVQTTIFYFLLLIVQWSLATRAANIYGRRLVTTVIALKSVAD